MRCLWLTLADPDPAHNGQYIYSAGLINAVAAAGVELVVLGLKRPELRRRDGACEGPIEWRLSECPQRPRWLSLGARLPHMAQRCSSREMQCRLHEELDRAELDMIVFDSLAAGWALKAVLEHIGSRRRQKLIYVSHNHEASLRAGLAAEQPRRIKRIAHRLDAGKVARLECELIRACDLVTAITPEDADRYRAVWPGKRIEVLTPGYAGAAVPRRIIGKAVPRRAVIVGSFEWIAKQMNLEEFVGFADPILAAGNAELQVIGSGERTFFDRLEKRTAATHFTGTVDRVENFMAGARIAVVPERNGGGFKLKVLDYVFNRLPIVALAGSIAGTPLRDHESVLLFPDQRSLATGVLRAMDDVDELNRLQELAFSICRDAFDWHRRGRQLVSWAASL